MKPGPGGMADARRTAKMRPPMRSSIACLRCRKSKIKCENDGGNSACDTCIKTGKQCVFKMPEPTPVPLKRTDPPAGVKQEREGGSDRKKLKRIDDVSKMDNQMGTQYAEDVLSAAFLTEDLWDQILDIYTLHFMPELPFLHLVRVKEKLSQKMKSPQADLGPDFNLVLLGILTLTARFVPDLVKYLAHVGSAQSGNARSRPVQLQTDPATASEFYAEALSMALGPGVRHFLKTPSVERVQALLMLGLYEWGQTLPRDGSYGAWSCVGEAIRMAQYLKLGFGDATAEETNPGRLRPGDSRALSSRSGLALDKEIRRRTMFSCFILDRMVACGKERACIIQPEDLQIQLPCSEADFNLGMEARTAFLKQLSSPEESVLSRFIRLVDIWGEISKFSSRGGRLTEKYPPWHPDGTFKKLRDILEAFDKNLPETFTLSKTNYWRHGTHEPASVYVLLHMLRCVCAIMLHREYIPFVPIRCRHPVGPLDHPIFPEDEYDVPEGFWEASAQEVFRAARDIISLIEYCQRKDKLPQSSLVVFCVWTAAFVALYGAHFPQMDSAGYLSNYQFEIDRRDEAVSETLQKGATGLTFQTLNKMSYWLKMASTYVVLLQQMDKYFVRIRQDYKRHVEKNNKLSDETKMRIRLGGAGGGLEEYRLLTSALKDFNFLRPDDQVLLETFDRSRASTIDRASSHDGEGRGAGGDPAGIPRSMPSGSFTAINHAQQQDPSSRPDSRSGGRPGSHAGSSAEPWHRSPYQGGPYAVPPINAYSASGTAHDGTTTSDSQSSDWNNTQPQQEEVVQHLKDLQKVESTRFGGLGDYDIFGGMELMSDWTDEHGFQLFMSNLSNQLLETQPANW